LSRITRDSMRAYHFFNIIVALLTLSSCANIGSPNGGEKDTSSPILGQTKPENYSLNFSVNEIRLQFDEYIVVDESKILMSPPLPSPIQAVTKGKEVRIRIPKDLKPNTTYTLSLEEAITDLNEGNAFRGSKYIFSTGEYLDSASFEGKVSDPFNLLGASNFVVALYPAHLELDSATHTLPTYYTRTNEQGVYELNYLAEGEYHILCFEDLNSDLILDSETDRIGVCTRPIVIPKDSSFTFTIYNEQSPSRYLGARQIGEKNILFLFSGLGYEWDIRSELEGIFWKDSKDSILFWYHASGLDSSIFYIGGINSRDTSIVYLKNKEDVKPLSFTTNLKDGKLHPSSTLRFKFNSPVIEFNPSKIQIVSEQNDTLPIQFVDSLQSKGLLEVEAVFKEELKYDVYLFDSCFGNILWKFSDSTSFELSVPANREYGNLKIGLIDSTSYHVELWTTGMNHKIKESEIMNGIYSYNLLEPGSYLIRIIEDLNHNKRWDAGDLQKGIEAEKIYFYPEAISIRANWDVEYEIGTDIVK